jgi:2-methylcitrate dehydratase PrpD
VSLQTLKRNVLDSIACALGALDGELIPAIRAQAEDFSSRPTATFVGGGRASVDQAAFFNAVLVRYPDLLDTYLTPGGLCHPADNFGTILAMTGHVEASGAGCDHPQAHAELNRHPDRCCVELRGAVSPGAHASPTQAPSSEREIR